MTILTAWFSQINKLAEFWLHTVQLVKLSLSNLLNVQVLLTKEILD
jgi:hypothetical protein